MAESTAQRKPAASNTVALDTHALGTLQYIRASMDAAGLLAVPGSAGVAMGAVGLLATLLVALPAFAPYLFEVWLAAGVVAFVCGSALMVHQALRRGATLYRGPARRFLLCLAPPLLAGAVLTWTLWRYGVERMVPGTWLLLYGCAVAAAGTMTIRPVSIMGGLFVLLGVVTLQLPLSVANVMLGAGFGGLHLTFGILIGRMRHGE